MRKKDNKYTTKSTEEEFKMVERILLQKSLLYNGYKDKVASQVITVRLQNWTARRTGPLVRELHSGGCSSIPVIVQSGYIIYILGTIWMFLFGIGYLKGAGVAG